jgi:hypothetical protein
VKGKDWKVKTGSYLNSRRSLRLIERGKGVDVLCLIILCILIVLISPLAGKHHLLTRDRVRHYSHKPQDARAPHPQQNRGYEERLFPLLVGGLVIHFLGDLDGHREPEPDI